MVEIFFKIILLHWSGELLFYIIQSSSKCTITELISENMQLFFVQSVILPQGVAIWLRLCKSEPFFFYMLINAFLSLLWYFSPVKLFTKWLKVPGFSEIFCHLVVASSGHTVFLIGHSTLLTCSVNINQLYSKDVIISLLFWIQNNFLFYNFSIVF